MEAENWPDRFINRELSWLDFNERVLRLADDQSTPLLERVRFVAIFSANLDEFFMVRVAGLKRQQEAGVGRSPDGMTPKQQLARIAEKARPLAHEHASLFGKELLPALAEADVHLRRWAELEETQLKEVNELFTDRIFPVVTPLAVDPGHPFPWISNLSLNLAVLVRDPIDDRARFARVKVPPSLPRFIELTEGGAFVPLEDVIAGNLHQLFPGMEVLEHHAFRVTRNGDLEVDDDGAEDLLEALELELSRSRFSPAVRLEVESDIPDHVLDLLIRELQVQEADVHALPGPLDLSGLWSLYDLDRPDLKDEPFQPATPPDLSTSEGAPVDIFSVLREKDVLVHHPYDSFTTSVQHFIEQAAVDPDVLAIKQTLYRTSGQSPIVNALIEAARAGKQVVVLVEIKARFDEEANINWARTLERAGCHVVYGLVGLKTHCKLSMIVRSEKERLRRYVHVGTGNYNPKTARLYEDLGLLTSDAAIGEEVGHLFNYLTGYSRQHYYENLVIAPHGLRKRMVDLIEREAELAGETGSGRIVMKLNNLVDERIVDALYLASAAGVQVELIVRAICALRPGVPNLSDNITVRSILGRFLEHSRVFYFHNQGEEDIYIGSADMMHRNLDRRVEALVRVKRPDTRARINEILELALSDNCSAWSLSSEGIWHRIEPSDDQPRIDLQQELMSRASVHA